MDIVRQIRRQLDSDEVRAHRHSRRELKERIVYAELQDSLAELTGSFTERIAGMWSMHRPESTQKIEGHAGVAAALFVADTLGEYSIQGSVKTRYSGMEREAGKGGHGISEGTILVTVEMTPLHGMAQIIDVPVYVHDSYLQRPGLMYHQGAAMVIAQSSIDEILSAGEYHDQELKTDRRHLFAPPKLDTKKASVSIDATIESQGSVGAQAAMPLPPQREMVQNMSRRDIDRQNSAEQMQLMEDQKAKERRKMRTAPKPGTVVPIVRGNPVSPGRVAPVAPGPGQVTLPRTGQLVRLACEIRIPTNDEQTYGYVLDEGSRVFVVSASNTGVHVKHESGLEAIVHPTVLATNS